MIQNKLKTFVVVVVILVVLWLFFKYSHIGTPNLNNYGNIEWGVSTNSPLYNIEG